MTARERRVTEAVTLLVFTMLVTAALLAAWLNPALAN